jgi:hypothetical protein
MPGVSGDVIIKSGMWVLPCFGEGTNKLLEWSLSQAPATRLCGAYFQHADHQILSIRAVSFTRFNYTHRPRGSPPPVPRPKVLTLLSPI